MPLQRPPRPLSLLSALILAPCAFAAGPYPRSTHELALGVTRQDADPVARSSTPELPAVDIDLDGLNAAGDEDSWYAEYRWRFRERWMLELFAYQYEDSGRATAEADLNYEGVEYTAGTLIETDLEINTYAVDVLYAVHQAERSELLIGGGIHALELSASLAGVVAVGDQGETFSGATDTLLAPVPNVRAQGSFALTERIGADLTLGWMSVGIDDYEGDFTYLHARLRARLTRRASLSVGYLFTDVGVSYSPEAGREHTFDAELAGPSLHFSWAF